MFLLYLLLGKIES